MKWIQIIYNRLCNNRLLSATIIKLYRSIKRMARIPSEKKRYKTVSSQLKQRNPNKKCIFYLGSPLHANLGDLAQGVCIRRWIHAHYPKYDLFEIKTNAIVNTRFSILNNIKKTYKKGDIIIFQSGYATTDLGGYADDMHCAVIEALPDAKILMMPQTILFEKEDREERTSKIYNSASKMLFLARDRVSYSKALSMFPDLKVMKYPDIVTTLIGTREYKNQRAGILFCCRDDSEKLYTVDEIKNLMKECSKIAKVDITDTTKYKSEKEIISNPEKYIYEEIEKYSHYKIVITDRYHGTIFSLIAGTPVVIIKSTDHKVTTGADWFTGIYDDYVYLANDLEDASQIAKKLYNKEFSHLMSSYFEKEYYDKLPKIFADI